MTKEGKLVEGGIAEHTEQCIKNLGNVLAAAGSSWEKVVKVNIYLKSMDDYPEMNTVYERVSGCRPMTCRADAQIISSSYFQPQSPRGLAFRRLSYPPIVESRSNASLPCKSICYIERRSISFVTCDKWLDFIEVIG